MPEFVSEPCKTELQSCRDRIKDLEDRVRELEKYKADLRIVEDMKGQISDIKRLYDELIKKFDELRSDRKADLEQQKKLQDMITSLSAEVSEMGAKYEIIFESQTFIKERVNDTRVDVSLTKEDVALMKKDMIEMKSLMGKMSNSFFFKFFNSIGSMFENKFQKWFVYLFLLVLIILPIFALIYFSTGNNVFSILIDLFLK